MKANHYPYTIDGKLIGEKIREFRKVRNWTQGELARRLNIHQPILSNVEKGGKRMSIEVFRIAVLKAEKIFNKRLLQNLKVNLPPHVKGVEKHSCPYCGGNGFFLKAFDTSKTT